MPTPKRPPSSLRTPKPRNRPKPRLLPSSKSKSAAAVRDLRTLFASAHRAGYLKQLWNLITALRGPDSNNDYHKSVTTTRIRTALITEAHRRHLNLSPGSFRRCPRNDYPHIEMPPEGSLHFYNHIRYARDVLASAFTHPSR